MHRRIEEYTLNAWPALQTLILDGWLLRFADGYTKRSNSVNPIFAGQDEHLDQKIRQCEAIYAKAGLDTIFKITPFAPSDLDAELENRGYAVVDPSSVRVLQSLDSLKGPTMRELDVLEGISDNWLDTMAGFNRMLRFTPDWSLFKI